MTDIVFGLIILVLIGWHYLDRKQSGDTHNGTIDHLQGIIKDLAKERGQDKAVISKLTNAVIAKNAIEARDLDMADKVNPITVGQPVQEQPDLIPEAAMSDEEFDKHIAELVANEKTEEAG